jgi:WD40 repeat protein
MRKLIILIIGVTLMMLSACDSGSTTGESSPWVNLPRISVKNAGTVSLLRSLEIPGFMRGNLSQCSLAFNPDGTLLIGVCGLNPVPVWEVGSGAVRYSLYQTDPVQIVACTFNPDGSRIACGGFNKIITIWDASSGARLKELGAQNSPIWELAYSPDGQRIASAGFSDELNLWDVNSGERLWTTTGIRGILSVSYHPSGASIAYGTHMMDRAGVLETASGEVLTTLSGPSHNVGDIEINQNGTLIAAGCDDDRIYLWKSNDFQVTGTLSGHSGYVNGVGFNPNGTVLASGSHDKTVGIWDVAGQKQLTSLYGHDEAVLRVAFNPQGTLLASISWDGTLKLWGVNAGQSPAP